MKNEGWQDVGSVDELSRKPLTSLTIDRTKIALVYKDGVFSAISGVCNHVGGPLGEGVLQGDYVVCPWHHWKFHCRTGFGEPGFEDDRVPQYETKIEKGRLFIQLNEVSRRNKLPHAPHPLSRKPQRTTGPIRVVGISTTMMNNEYPRYSGSDDLLLHSLKHAEKLGGESKIIYLRDLQYRNCEGYYSKSAKACTWPCSITQMDPKDQMDQVYEAFVHWADIVLLATPIRWGAASSLYYKMVERLNCVQNRITTHDEVLIQNKVASFIIIGGQDNVQAVAGQMMGFFGEIGFLFPQFPYIAHSRGWSAEDMERNVTSIQKSVDLREGAEALVQRSFELASRLIEKPEAHERLARGGRKAFKERER